MPGGQPGIFDYARKFKRMVSPRSGIEPPKRASIAQHDAPGGGKFD